MKKKPIRYWMLLLCLLAQQVVSATSTDSIRQLIPSLKGEAKAKALIDLYLAYYAKGEVDSTLMTLDELIAFQHDRDSVKEEGKARWNRIAILNNAARFAELADEAVEQMAWYRKQGIWDRYYQAWQRKCSAYHDMGKVQTSLREARLMHDDAAARSNYVGQAMAYKQMGVVYFDLHQFEQARDAFQESARLLIEAKDSVGMLSGVYDFQCKALHELKRYKDELDLIGPWKVYLERMSHKQGDRVVKGPLCSLYLAQASALLGLQRQDEAEACLKEAEECNRVIPTALASYYIYTLHMEACLVGNEVDRALAYADSVEQLGEVFDNRLSTIKAKALMQAGRSDEAVRIYEQLYETNDSIYSRDMRMQLDELNTLFQVDELKLQTQLSHQKSLIIAIIIVVVALLFLIYFRFKASRRLEREHKLVEEANQYLEDTNRQLATAKAQAEESSRMKTNFIQQISHEIRTPLNILSGFTQVITTPGLELDDATKADINKRITENTDRITSLVNKMLELSEANSQAVIERSDDVQAVHVAAQAVEESRISVVKHIVFTVAVDDDVKDVVLHTNLRNAVRALSLLLDNAQKFTKDGAVCLRVVQHVAAQQSSAQNFLAFVVEDTGIGIPPEEAERVFDEFVQLDEYYDGTGIGLTVARSIARRLGGDIVLDTKYEGGARFVFTLPLS